MSKAFAEIVTFRSTSTAAESRPNDFHSSSIWEQVAVYALQTSELEMSKLEVSCKFSLFPAKLKATPYNPTKSYYSINPFSMVSVTGSYLSKCS